MPSPEKTDLVIRPAMPADVAALHDLEQSSFARDRLSRRRLRHWVTADNCVFLLAERDTSLLGYALVILRRGTRLARLYSLAVASSARGQGIGRCLVSAVERAASDSGRFFMRLEVAEHNQAAIALYQALGYRAFGRYLNYYQDDSHALRMQKRIHYHPENLHRLAVPWYRQTTDFTCGPAAAMMAMAALDSSYRPSVSEELALWREATTIFMTSGHGGCHPVGLGLALRARGFDASVYLNREGPLFIDSVRAAGKKKVISQVDADFRAAATAAGMQVVPEEFTQEQLQQWLGSGALVLLLVSTYRLDGKKVPHWVTLVGMDDRCLYVHDPDSDELWDQLDSSYLPIAREDFARMSMFGRERLRTAVVVRS
ncbi:GNAT family N-acetyltransferase/peptidase C39 family protein [Microbulbifer sediminum]|uniref:GNAT family N-acetyltransferase/peptidase C39 family protein n=1 Tax=Microbulbifer sediminum TaxID=2904250 RepID=UPI001F3AC533|nr:GNAT family N-acetyltransferase/peptidase C39 family protein [Microbulbifer sediminum]